MIRDLLRRACLLAAVLADVVASGAPGPPEGTLRAGAASADIAADDDMVIGGGIHPGRARGQEGALRASAVVIAANDGNDAGASTREAVAIVSCDVLMIRRDYLDPAARRIEKKTGIPFANVLINATHTHHAPSTTTVHAYERSEVFCERVRDAVVAAVVKAHERMSESGPVEMLFRLGQEASVGQNSRLLLGDGTIYWTGRRDDIVRPTGPFDPDLPVLAFRSLERSPAATTPLRALVFNHSTHLIGTRKPGVRSPSFYGLAAQELEKDLAETVVFVSGAFGSTHNLTLGCDEMVLRMKDAIRRALRKAKPLAATPIRAVRKEITYRVRRFDEAAEDAAVVAYCTKRIQQPESVYTVFRTMRKHLAPHQGEERRTWLQALRIGDVAIVAVPGEFFTVLGIDIKRASPFRYTAIAGVANDYIGYIPDDEAYDLGGYQVWTGYHSLVERGTGEMIVREAVRLLEELHDG